MRFLIAVVLSTVLLIAQSPVYDPAFPGLSLTLANPLQGNDPNDRRAVRFDCSTSSISSNPNFSDENCLEVVETVTNGQALYGGGTQAKKTFLPLNITGIYTGSGQKFLLGENLTCYSMSDCNAETRNVAFAGGPIAGDESQGIQSVSYLQQQTTLIKTAVSGNSVRTSCNTTLTQNVTASKDAQAVSVASTSGCNVNDWVVIGQEAPTSIPNEIAVQITVVAGSTITGVFNANYSSGATVTPATVLTVTSTGGFGQDRVLVDLTIAPYNTGTVTDTSAATFTGSGTSWSTGMVGGTALVPGCVSLTNDDYSGAPFNGSGASGTLKSWYQITGSITSTSLHPYTTSVAGNGGYAGNGVGTGAYTIRPCAKVLRILGNTTVVLETNSFAWANADSVELAITPYPDVTGYQYQTNVWTTGGIRRAFMNVRNAGARTWNYGFLFDDVMPVGGGADTVPWSTGIYFSRVGTGIKINESQTGNAFVANATSTNAASALPCFAFQGIGFGGSATGTGLCGDGNTGDMELGVQGFTVLGIRHGKNAAFTNGGTFGIETVLTVSTLPTCNSGMSGSIGSVSDATAPTYLGTLTGSGSVHTPVYCNGTAWVSY